MEGLIIGAVISYAGALTNAYGQYEQGKAARDQAEAQAQLAELQSKAQGKMVAEYERQRVSEMKAAGNEQVAGEMEAMKRQRAMAQEIGSQYANFAGNGVLISGSESESFAKVMSNIKDEARHDTEVINANTFNNAWSRTQNALAVKAQRDQAYMGAQSSLISADAYHKQGAAAYSAGITSAIGTAIGGTGTFIKDIAKGKGS